jgi:hypothetical protein
MAIALGLTFLAARRHPGRQVEDRSAAVANPDSAQAVLR